MAYDRQFYEPEGGEALDSSNNVFDVTQWRKDASDRLDALEASLTAIESTIVTEGGETQTAVAAVQTEVNDEHLATRNTIATKSDEEQVKLDTLESSLTSIESTIVTEGNETQTAIAAVQTEVNDEALAIRNTIVAEGDETQAKLDTIESSLTSIESTIVTEGGETQTAIAAVQTEINDEHATTRGTITTKSDEVQAILNGDLRVYVGKAGENLDMANRLRTSEKEELFTHTNIYTKNHTMLENLVGSATTTHNYDTASCDLACTTASGDKAMYQSFFYIPYLPGSPMLVKMTGAMAATKANVAQRMGYFDDNDGLFFEDNGTNMGVVRRTSTSGSVVNNRTAQASWNIDTLDGNGPSGETISTWNRHILFWVEFLWQGAVGCRWGVIYNGKWIAVHEFLPTTETVPFIRTPSLPCRYEIENTGVAASATTLKAGCVDVAAEGGHRLVGSDWSFSNFAAPVNVGTTEEVVLVARFKNSFNSKAVRRTLKLLEIQALSADQNAHFRVAIVHKPTSVTGGTWVDMDTTHSAIEYNIGQPTITGGDAHDISHFIVSANNQISGLGFSESRFEDTHTLAAQNFDSTNSDLLVLYATSVTTTTDVYASMKLLEFE